MIELHEFVAGHAFVQEPETLVIILDNPFIVYKRTTARFEPDSATYLVLHYQKVGAYIKIDNALH